MMTTDSPRLLHLFILDVVTCRAQNPADWVCWLSDLAYSVIELNSRSKRVIILDDECVIYQPLRPLLTARASFCLCLPIPRVYSTFCAPVPVNQKELSTLPTLTLPSSRARVVIVLEGANDIEFLRRISAVLHRSNPSLPNLACWERQGRLIFLSFGGGSVRPWADRLAPLKFPEFHLYDREMPPETELRHAAASIVNRRNRCRAFVTRKRTLENYLDPEAIRDAIGIDFSFAEMDSVPEMAVRALLEKNTPGVPWQALPKRAQSRRVQRIKRWLNSRAVDCMTSARLVKSDPHGELISWLQTIVCLAELREC